MLVRSQVDAYGAVDHLKLFFPGKTQEMPAHTSLVLKQYQPRFSQSLYLVADQPNPFMEKVFPCTNGCLKF